MSTADLPNHEKLKWVKLPKCTARKACDDEKPDLHMAGAERLENREVKPITAGSERTSVMVRVECIAE
eukprot:5223702-Pleurochrysis_carterae.AAC.1